MSEWEKIEERALKLLEEEPNGIRFHNLAKKVQEEFPGIKWNSLRWTVWNLPAKFPQQVYKPSKGLFKHLKYKNIEEEVKETKELKPKIKEEDFYQPFADWIVQELEECTKAIPLGGKRFGDKWGTPDVLGVYKAPEKYILPHDTEIVSAEIKLDTNELITAFGQACAYKLFSHKTYLVIPKSSPSEDIDKIDSLCVIFAIGLILFDSTNKEDPHFEIKTRARKHEPDMFYVNEYMRKDKRVEDELFG